MKGYIILPNKMDKSNDVIIHKENYECEEDNYFYFSTHLFEVFTGYYNILNCQNTVKLEIDFEIYEVENIGEYEVNYECKDSSYTFKECRCKKIKILEKLNEQIIKEKISIYLNAMTCCSKQKVVSGLVRFLSKMNFHNLVFKFREYLKTDDEKIILSQIFLTNEFLENTKHWHDFGIIGTNSSITKEQVLLYRNEINFTEMISSLNFNLNFYLDNFDKLKGYIDYFTLLYVYQLPESFIQENGHQIGWAIVARFQKLSKKFIENNKRYLDAEILKLNSKLEII